MRYRKTLIAVLMTTLCLLCACAGKADDPLQAPMDFRTTLLAEGGCSFELDALAESGELLWQLSLRCELDAGGVGTVTVLAPESIAGISARSEGGSGSLVFDGVCLGLGTLPGTELSPAAAPGRLVRAWSRGWIASAGAEDGKLLVCYEDDGLTVRTWFDAENLPIRAELSIDGRTRFTAEIRSFTWKETP